MQSFTTQSHQRNYQGNVVVENPNRASGYRNRQQRRHKVLFGLTAVMALAVAVTGSMLGATAIHNRQLKNQLHTLQTQATQVVAEVENNTDFADMLPPDASYYTPMTLEARPDEMEIREDEGERTPTPYEHRKHGHRRGHRRAPISDKQHEAQPLPAIDRNHTERN